MSEDALWGLEAYGHRAARQAGLSPDDAEDCASDFVLSAVERPQLLRELDGTPRSDGWIGRCALNFARNRARALWRRLAHETEWPDEASSPNEEPADPAPGPEECLLATERSSAARRALAELSSLDRAVFVAHHVQHKGIEALAVRYGATQGAIKQRLRRTRRKLAHSLAQANAGRS